MYPFRLHKHWLLQCNADIVIRGIYLGARIIWYESPDMDGLLWQDRFDLAREAGCIDAKKLRNLELSLKEEASGKTKLESLPAHYLIEATNRCNLRCTLCPTQYDDSDMPRGYIDISIFNSLIRQIKENAKVLSLQNWGEPLLHLNIIDIITEAYRRIIFTVISTSFSLNLQNEFIENILTSGLGVLHVDVDGMTQDVYETYRRKGRLDTVLQNLQLVCSAKKRLGRNCQTKIETSMIINKFNEHQESTYREAMRKLGVDRIKISKLQISPNTSSDWLPENKDKKYLNYSEPTQDAKSCQRLYTQLTVNWDGPRSPCCLTYDTESDFSKADHCPDISKIWNNEFFQSARAAFSGMNDGPTTICHKCMNNLGRKDLPHSRNSFAIALRSEL